MAFTLPAASTEDVIRASLKDDYYITEIIQNLKEALSLLLPAALTAHPRLHATVSALVRLSYLCFSQSQPLPRTPGEEYAGIVPLSQNATPSPYARFVRALLRCLRTTDVLRLIRSVWATSTPEAFPASSARSLSAAISRAHLAVFYITGAFYDAPARIANTRYVRVVRQGEPPLRAAYAMLGVALAAQTAIGALSAVRDAMLRATRAKGRGADAPVWRLALKAIVHPDVALVDHDGKGNSVAERTCALCLSHMRHPTMTVCGHLFCWQCILQWCLSKEICPLCRRHVASNQLVCLYQF